MKNVSDTRGPFAERPYYEQGEVDRMCLAELRAMQLLPAEPAPIRIERFIEKRFKISVFYEDVPSGVLGYSRFGKQGLEAVVVSRALADDASPVAERRVLTTLAHEAGHALLHAHLFALGDPQPGLFGEGVSGPKIMCRDEADPSQTELARYAGKWWEYQANQAIGGLLLPSTLVRKALQPLLTAGGRAFPALPDTARTSAASLLAGAFNVNPVVARIRLDGLFPRQGAQLTL
jgi:hypothetical protein